MYQTYLPLVPLTFIDCVVMLYPDVSDVLPAFFYITSFPVPYFCSKISVFLFKNCFGLHQTRPRMMQLNKFMIPSI